MYFLYTLYILLKEKLYIANGMMPVRKEALY